MQIHSPTDEGTVRKEKVRAEFLGYKEVETIEKMEMWIETPWKYDMRQQNKKGREKKWKKFTNEKQSTGVFAWVTRILIFCFETVGIHERAHTNTLPTNKMPTICRDEKRELKRQQYSSSNWNGTFLCVRMRNSRTFPNFYSFDNFRRQSSANSSQVWKRSEQKHTKVMKDCRKKNKSTIQKCYIVMISKACRKKYLHL